MVVSLYEASQELPDARYAEAQMLLIGVDPLFVTLYKISKTEEFEWSDEMASSLPRDFGSSFWTSANKHELK